MPYKDLREWLSVLEAEGELKRISAAVHWDEELGGIARAALDMKEQGPALLFESIKDYEAGQCTKLFTGSVGNYARMSLMLGLPKESRVKELINTVRERTAKPIKPVVIGDGPVKENVARDKEVNILEFPVPKWHAQDGGRYIVTFAGMVTKDPETGWVNIGLYRGMAQDERTIGCAFSPAKHAGQHYHKYRSQGKPMPVAIIFGWDPVLPFTACAPYPTGVCEYDMMGALREQPVELVKCETIELEVPATAEIVMEGTMSPQAADYRREGPFGEYTGYYAGVVTERPAINIHCITHRNNPIFQGTFEGPPIDEDHRCCSVSMSALAWDLLEKNGVPGITDVFCPPLGFATNIRVQINKRYQGHAKQVAACLWGSTAQACFKNVIVVEEDIDIHDSDQVEWAFSYRVNAKDDGIVIFPGCPGSYLDPSNNPEWNDPMKYGGGRWNRLLIDATRDWRFGPREEWGGERFPPLAEVRPEIKELVKRRWKEYGF